MSIEYLNAAFVTPLCGAKKGVMIALSDRASNAGYAYPGIDDICLRSGYKKRAVINAIDQLEKLGFLAVARSQGRVNKYIIFMDKLSTASALNTPVEELYTGAPDALGSAPDTKTSAPDAPEPLEPPITKERDFFKNQKNQNQINPMAYKIYKPSPMPKAKKEVASKNLTHIYALIGCHHAK